MESSSTAKSKNDKAWRAVSEEIKKIFRTAVLQLQEKGTMKSAQAKKFLCSGTSYIYSVFPATKIWTIKDFISYLQRSSHLLCIIVLHDQVTTDLMLQKFSLQKSILYKSIVPKMTLKILRNLMPVFKIWKIKTFNSKCQSQ